MVAEIRESISSGTLAEGDRLPSEAELGKRYGISVCSVRRGIDTLITDNILVRRQGSGTYVLEAATQKLPSVRRDTVALVLPLMVRGYHPYISEKSAGIRQEILDQGFRVWECPYGPAPADNRDFACLPLDIDKAAEAILSRQEIAGVIAGASLVTDFRKRLGADMTMVAVDPTPDCPFAGYDWDEELAAGLRLLLLRGCRRIWCHRYVDREKILQLLPSGASKQIEFNPHHFTCTLLSEITAHAYQVAKEKLAAKNYDGILLGSDFEAQGVLDALAALDKPAEKLPQIVALVNRKSRINTNLPVIKLVADGEAEGHRIAQLFFQLLLRAAEAPRQVYLRSSLEEP